MQKGKVQKVQKKGVTNQKIEGVQSVAEIFSVSRDVQMMHPYHMDGDMEMYSEEKLAAREQLKNDSELVKQLDQLSKQYKWSQIEGVGKVIDEKEYKLKQKTLALILRPEMDSEQLQFVVQSDWQHDRLTSEKGEHYLTKDKLIQSLWQLVDVWTVGATREEYISFTRLLKKKLQRAQKTSK